MMAIRERLRNRALQRAYDTAREQAETHGRMLCGTYKPDGTPVYFEMDKETPDSIVATRAFEIRNGRAPLPAELYVLAQAAKLHQKRSQQVRA